MNFIAVTILIALFAVWKLDFIATLLNLRAYPEEVPALLRDVLDADRLATGRQYTQANAQSAIIRSTASLTALLVCWFIGGFAWADAFAASFGRGPVTTGLIFLTVVFLASHLFELPFRIHETFRIEGRFGFNLTTPATFAVDELKGLALAAGLGLPLAAAVLWLFHHLPHAWLWAWLVVSAVQLLLTWLAPTLIYPIFNKFTPMPAGETRAAIEALAARCAFPLDELFVMDGSRRSSRGNAFFTGFGRHKRIALFDTLIEKHTTPELVAVLAHEIGHFKLRHIPQRLAVMILQSAALFFLLGLATNPHGAFARQLFAAFGIDSVSPHAGLVLFAILWSPAARILGVLSNAWSRRHEFQADAYARQVTGTPETLATALKKLTTDNLSHPSPHPLRVALDYSHPPLARRLRALLEK